MRSDAHEGETWGPGSLGVVRALEAGATVRCHMQGSPGSLLTASIESGRLHSHPTGGEAEGCSPFGKQSGNFLTSYKCAAGPNSCSARNVFERNEAHVHTQIWMQKLRAALFTVAEEWKPQCPSNNERVSESWSSLTVEHDSANAATDTALGNTVPGGRAGCRDHMYGKHQNRQICRHRANE